MRTLGVWWDGRVVGQLTQDPHGELGFAYAPAWLDDAPPCRTRRTMRDHLPECTGVEVSFE